MKKLLLLSALLIFAGSSDLFAQDYMKMRKKQLRIEHQKKLKLIDSLSQELSLSNKKSQNLQFDLNNSSNDLTLTSDSLKNSNLEITQLEAKLLISKNELSLLGLEIDNLNKQNSDNLDLITDKNLQIDSLRTSLNIASDEKSDLMSQNSLKTITIDSLKIENNDLKEKLNEEKIVEIKPKDLKNIHIVPVENCGLAVGEYERIYNFLEMDNKFYLLETDSYDLYLLYEIESVYENKTLELITINLKGTVLDIEGREASGGIDDGIDYIPIDERKIIIKSAEGNKFYLKNNPKAYIICIGYNY